LHIGTLATIVEPGATHLFAWAKQVKAPLIFDPNIRSSVVSDRALYQGIVEKWASIASVIKLSDEDLAWLYPGQEEQQIARHFLHSAAELVVVTKGAEGMTAYTEGAEISVPGVKVQVVDTVGAGDTVGAILTEAIVKYGLENLVGDTLKKVLNRAAKAAAITCSRPGANPPNQKELEGF
jgi:fructokinase